MTSLGKLEDYLSFGCTCSIHKKRRDKFEEFYHYINSFNDEDVYLDGMKEEVVEKLAELILDIIQELQEE